MEVMTLNEAIQHCEEVAEENNKCAELIRDKMKSEIALSNATECETCAEEHRQLAEWLKELKLLREQTRWIPVSERLPKDSQLVLMTIRRMGEHWNHEPFISVGYISWNQTAWWCAHDGDCKSHDVRVDAWMPLPEPYKSERKEA